MLPELDLWEGVLRIVLAAGLAGAIGLERESAEQEAGLRTHILVSVGACLFMIVGVYGWEGLRFSSEEGVIVDPSRIGSYIVAGIGFLGGGAIIRQGVNVKGLTTAASIWVVAAIGTTVAIGMYSLAVASTALVLLSLWPLKALANALGLRQGGTQRLLLELDPVADVAPLIGVIDRLGLELGSIRVDEAAEVRQVDLVLGARQREVAALADELAALEQVRSVQWPA